LASEVGVSSVRGTDLDALPRDVASKPILQEACR